ncbi:MAG TPA: hypothetical protein VN840_18660 [Streptosporangiaceae bacterium]|nr:hypothetical protein [Streptosporangiaceae bacterium]
MMKSLRNVTAPAKEAPQAMKASGGVAVAQYVREPAMIEIAAELKIINAALTDIISSSCQFECCPVRPLRMSLSRGHGNIVVDRRSRR